MTLALLVLPGALPTTPATPVEIATPAAAMAAPGRRTDAVITSIAANWFKAEWRSYADRFIAADGRVVDNANGGVSHSEGQGYGLLLAARAGDAERFDRLWRWTAAHLMIRPDGLAAWKWDPAAGKVTDTNNATDGDILLAWALADGAQRFGRPDYRAAAERIARAVGAVLVRPTPSGPILLPGAKGFGEHEQPDGPVINLSYWVYPAFAALKQLDPGTDWDGLHRRGLAILEASRFGPYGLPTEWESLAEKAPRPARSFPAEFGYNAVRIPLYLALDGGEPARKALRRFAGLWAEVDSAVHLLDVKAASITPPLNAPGYDLVFALARCAAAGQVIPPEMISTRGTLYYPETLRLLSVAALQERLPACL